MSRQVKNSITGKVILQSNRMTAGKIYVPTKLRAHVPTVQTSSGTRLSSKK
jgi:hypothetical protein